MSGSISHSVGVAYILLIHESMHTCAIVIVVMVMATIVAMVMATIVAMVMATFVAMVMATFVPYAVMYLGI